jgi:hypothetical protein
MIALVTLIPGNLVRLTAIVPEIVRRAPKERTRVTLVSPLKSAPRTAEETTWFSAKHRVAPTASASRMNIATKLKLFIFAVSWPHGTILVFSIL